MRTKIFFQLFLGVLILLTSVLAVADQTPADPSEDQPVRHPVLKQFEDKGGKVESLGSAYGTEGWLITNPQGGVQYAYTTPEGGIVIGMLFGPDGGSETKKQLEVFKQRLSGSQAAVSGPEKYLSKAERLYEKTENSGWVSLGDSKAPYLYVFMNVDCSRCQDFLKDLDSSVTEGRLQVRLIPFGVLAGNREGGAALLSVDNPAEAWRAYMNGDKTALAKEKIKAGADAKMDANAVLAAVWPKTDPPFIIYRRPADGKVVAMVGRPENTMLLQADLLPPK